MQKCDNASSMMTSTFMLSYIMPVIFIGRKRTAAGKDESVESVNQAECRMFCQELTHYVGHHFHYDQCNHSDRIPSWLAVKVQEESCVETHEAKADVYGICVGVP